MDDYDAIKETIYHYFDGSRTKDRTRLERAFAVDRLTGGTPNGECRMKLGEVG